MGGLQFKLGKKSLVKMLIFSKFMSCLRNCKECHRFLHLFTLENLQFVRNPGIRKCKHSKNLVSRMKVSGIARVTKLWKSYISWPFCYVEAFVLLWYLKFQIISKIVQVSELKHLFPLVMKKKPRKIYFSSNRHSRKIFSEFSMTKYLFPSILCCESINRLVSGM